MSAATDMHAVFATYADGSKARVTEPNSWSWTINRWNQMDEMRRGKRYAEVRFFEVRSMDDPKYKDLPIGHVRQTKKGRGFTYAEDAAKKAWKAWQGNETPHGTTQGTGGWFYWHNGRTAAQGAASLADICIRRGLIVEGADGRWHVEDVDA